MIGTPALISVSIFASCLAVLFKVVFQAEVSYHKLYHTPADTTKQLHFHPRRGCASREACSGQPLIVWFFNFLACKFLNSICHRDKKCNCIVYVYKALQRQYCLASFLTLSFTLGSSRFFTSSCDGRTNHLGQSDCSFFFLFVCLLVATSKSNFVFLCVG